jgi:hypothetical protein
MLYHAIRRPARQRQLGSQKALAKKATTSKKLYWPVITVWDENILNLESKSLLKDSHGKILSRMLIRDAPDLREAFVWDLRDAFLQSHIILLGV